MPSNPTSGDKRLQAPSGSYGAQQWLAAEEADEMEAEAASGPHPRLTILYGHVAEALEQAVSLTKMIFATPVPSAVSFIAKQTRLAERWNRIDQLFKDADLLSPWPKSPGVTFSWKAGWSALSVAAQFARMVCSGTSGVCPTAVALLDVLPVCPQPDVQFEAWRDRTITELKERQVSEHLWPDMGSIHRDYGSLRYKLTDEYERAMAGADMAERGRRRAVPAAVEAEVLTTSRRRCCICYGLHRDASLKKGQVAHLDHNPSNSELDNLAFLCQDHHDEYDSTHSQTKGMTMQEVKAYRQELSAAIRDLDAPLPSQVPTAVAQTNMNGDNIIVGGDVYLNRKQVKRNVVTPGPDHVPGAVALRIKELIAELADIDTQAGKASTFGQWYNRLYRHFNVTSYQLIPAEQGEEAIEWLQQQKAIHRPKLRRTNNEAWRRSHYTAIYARAGELGFSKQQLYELAQERLGLKVDVRSLKDIGERNLQKLHNILFSMER